jgi:molybdopterin-binding protein
VKRVVNGSVNCEVTVSIPGGIEITSIITRASVKRLGLKKGKAAYAIIKASDVLIATD